MQIRIGGGRQTHAAHIGAEFFKPERKPASFEAGMTGYQHALSLIKPVEHYQTFQGALPLFHKLVRSCCSRKVSMHCQNPVWQKAAIWPFAARRFNGSCSRTHLSSVKFSPMRLFMTKKPPLMKPVCCSAFSLKAVTVSPEISRSPNLPAGRTAVIVTTFLCVV